MTMIPLSLQITYRKGRPFAAYIYLSRRPGEKSARTESVGPDLLVDYAADGSPMGIEIVTPEAVSLDEVYALFDRLGIARPSPADLAPLQAA
jgi:uncharacterized protein YuzE